MLERPFGAMNGCWGTSWPAVGLGATAEPTNVGTVVASGSWGIGGGVSPGVCAWAGGGAAIAPKAATAMIAARLLITSQVSVVGSSVCRLTRRSVAGWKNGFDGGPETARVDPGSQPVDQHLDPGVPRGRSRDAGLLQRGRRGPARASV